MLNIKELRGMTGLTQAEFAEKYFISLQTVKQWEASRLSTAYRMPPDYALRLLETVILRDIEDGMVSLINEKYQKVSKKIELLDTAKDLWD
jgi:transcriptional regulator with XRE-family HTH domain